MAGLPLSTFGIKAEGASIVEAALAKMTEARDPTAAEKVALDMCVKLLKSGAADASGSHLETLARALYSKNKVTKMRGFKQPRFDQVVFDSLLAAQLPSSPEHLGSSATGERIFFQDSQAPAHTSSAGKATKLHQAAQFGHLKAIQELFEEEQASPAERDASLQTPLHKAAGEAASKLRTAENEAKKEMLAAPLDQAASEMKQGMVDMAMAFAAGKQDEEIILAAIDEAHTKAKHRNLEPEDEPYKISVARAAGKAATHVAAAAGESPQDVATCAAQQTYDAALDVGMSHDDAAKTAAAAAGKAAVDMAIIKDMPREKVASAAEEAALTTAEQLGIDNEGANRAAAAAAAKAAPLLPTILSARVQELALETCQVLLDAHADPSAQDCNCHTPLHMAAFCGHTKACKALLLAQANPSARGEDSKTPLHWAAEKGYEDVCQLLLDYTADLSVRETQLGDTALHTAARTASLGGHDRSTATYRMLVDASTEPTITNVKNNLAQTANDIFGERLLDEVDVAQS